MCQLGTILPRPQSYTIVSESIPYKERLLHDFILPTGSFLIATDQLMKWGIVQNFSLYDQMEVIPGIFSLYYIQNRGAAWGILEGRG